MIAKKTTHRLIFQTAIGLSVLFFGACGNDSIKIDVPDYSTQKYTDQEYAELIADCDKVITDYSGERNVSDLQNAKLQMTSLGLSWYSFYGKTVQAKFDSSKTEYFIKRDSAIKVLGGYQTKMFPKFRNSYIKYASDVLWEHDCEASVSGPQNEVLVLSGNYFLPNANKKQTFEVLKKSAEKFRFKKMRFKWYESSSDHFDFDINSSDDNSYISLTD